MADYYSATMVSIMPPLPRAGMLSDLGRQVYNAELDSRKGGGLHNSGKPVRIEVPPPKLT